MLKCINCNTEKNFNAFDKHPTGTYRKTCKICRNKQRIVSLDKKKNDILKVQSTILNKTCSKCNITKDISLFFKLIRSKDGYRKLCKDCEKLKQRKTNNNILDSNLNKSCSSCSYSGNNFKKCQKSSDGFYHICNNCWKTGTWTKEKQKESQQKYYDNNKEKLREKWKRDGLKINRRIRDSLNKRISSCLFSKKFKTFDYIGCDNIFLKLWFEYNFDKNMSWENYGEWHMDHIKPCASYNFSLEKDINECFNWKNLRPCWEKDNLEKSDKIDIELINTYKIKAEKFIEYYSTTKVNTKVSTGSEEILEV
jgi:hypothetical protein